VHKLIILIVLYFINFNSLNATEITFGISSYEYVENDNTNQGKFYMRDKSDPRFYDIGVKNWDKGILNNFKPAILSKYNLLYTFEYTKGDTAYFSASGTMKKPYSKQRYELYVARSINDNLSIFAGVGYRHLKDNSGGMLTNINKVGYDRYSEYTYFPVGFIYKYKSNWTLKNQYNFWGKGKQRSYIGEHDSNYIYVIENEQGYGYGLDFTLSRELFSNISIHTFYRFWEVDDSDWVNCYKDQSAVCQEPENETTEVGGGISYKF
jgi:hypothetical protein